MLVQRQGLLQYWQEETSQRAPSFSRESVLSATPLNQWVVPSKAQHFMESLDGKQARLADLLTREQWSIQKSLGTMSSYLSSWSTRRNWFLAPRWSSLALRKKMNAMISSHSLGTRVASRDAAQFSSKQICKQMLEYVFNPMPQAR